MPYKDPEYRKKYAKEVREWRKAHGFCTRCGHEKAEPGRSTCLVCKMDRRAYQIEYKSQPKVREVEAARRAYKRENHICYACSKPTYKNHAYCYEHYLAQKRQTKAWNDTYRNHHYPSNQCRICGAPVVKKHNDMGYSKFCATHYEQYLQNMKRANEVRLNEKEDKD